MEAERSYLQQASSGEEATEPLIMFASDFRIALEMLRSRSALALRGQTVPGLPSNSWAALQVPISSPA